MLLMKVLIDFIMFNNVQSMLRETSKDFVQLVWYEHAVPANVSLFNLSFYLFIIMYSAECSI